MVDRPSIKVEASPAFKRSLKNLGKKYRSIRKDIEPVILYYLSYLFEGLP